MMYNSYKGAIINQLFEAAQKNPTMTMGELFHSFLRKGFLGKNMLEATDEEVFTALERFTNMNDSEDEPYDDIGWDFHIQKLIIKDRD